MQETISQIKRRVVFWHPGTRLFENECDNLNYTSKQNKYFRVFIKKKTTTALPINEFLAQTTCQYSTALLPQSFLRKLLGY